MLVYGTIPYFLIFTLHVTIFFFLTHSVSHYLSSIKM